MEVTVSRVGGGIARGGSLQGGGRVRLVPRQKPSRPYNNCEIVMIIMTIMMERESLLTLCQNPAPLASCKSKRTAPLLAILPPAPLANSRVSARQSPGLGGGDGRQVTVSRGGGGIARVFQGKLWYPPLMQAKRTRVKRLSR